MSTINQAGSFKRLNRRPLDVSSTFENEAMLDNYLLVGEAFNGQVVSVVGNPPKVYKIGYDGTKFVKFPVDGDGGTGGVFDPQQVRDTTFSLATPTADSAAPAATTNVTLLNTLQSIWNKMLHLFNTRLRFDAAQTLTSEQAGRVLQNISTPTTAPTTTQLPQANRDRLKLWINAQDIWYGTSNTAAGTQDKASTITGFVRVGNPRVTIRLTVANTHATPRLNVTTTGAAEIRWNGQPIIASLLTVGDWDFQWDGTYWNWLNYPAAVPTMKPFDGSPAVIKMDMPSMRGRFQDRSLAAGVDEAITPVFESGINMVDGTFLIAPEKGTYVLSTRRFLFAPTTAGNVHVMVLASTESITTISEKSRHFRHDVSAANAGSFMSIVYVEDLKQGERIRVQINSAIARTSITPTSPPLSFLFRRIA